MVEGGRLPGIGGVASLAIGAKLAVMCIIASMAGRTGAGSATPTLGVTRLAGHIHVCARELE